MILIPEQISILRERKRQLEREKKSFDDYRESKDTSGLDVIHSNVPSDHFIDSSLNMIYRELAEINDVLVHSTYLKSRTVDKIEIGTRFLFQFLNEDEVCDFILVNKVIGVSSTDGFISKESSIGKMVFGKKSQDTIENIGTILETKTDYDDYLHQIKERIHSHRISSEEEKTMKFLNKMKNKNAIAQEEYRKRIMITQSQKELLEEEQVRILNGPLGIQEKARLGIIRKILRETPIASLPEDNTIGIGSTFTMMTFNEDRTDIKRVEMINHAVSNELENEYVERISPVGSQIFGLKNNEEFIYRKGSQFITGVVYDIDNSKDQIKTNNALTYQKLRAKMNK